MSSIEQFKRSRASKEESRLSGKSQQLGVVEVELSTHEIVFPYLEHAETLTCTDLKMSNFGLHSLYFRVLSNSPQYYEILPSQDILHSAGTTTFSFKLKKHLLALNPRDAFANTLDKVTEHIRKHLFYLQWGPLTDEQLRTNQIPELTSQQVLTVRIVEAHAMDYQQGPRQSSSYSLFEEDRLLNHIASRDEGYNGERARGAGESGVSASARPASRLNLE
jgi:hypothetical protein